MKYNVSTENINYIKFVCIDNQGFSHCIKASVKRADMREIYACAKCEEDLNIKTPQDIDLSIACSDGLYTGKTNLKYIQKEEEYVYFAFKTPDDVNYRQEREFFRVRLEEEALVYYTKNDKTEKKNAKIYDISANGVRLELDQKTDFPQDVQIVLKFPKKEVHALAKFIRNDNEDKILKSSFSFVDLSQSDLDYISQICIQKQLEDRRKNKLL